MFLTTLSASNPYKNITTYTLPNGLKVYLYPDKNAKNTAIDVSVKVGLKAEDEKTSGISHLVEHIVFRDARIKDRDYLDLFEKEGASHVNGHTRYYTTNYETTINPDKSYWIVEQFAQMIFDKNVSDIDLEAERGALQVEIGAYTWADKYLPSVQKTFDFLKDISPEMPDFYKDEFGIDIEEEKNRKRYPLSIYRKNNRKFTLKDVMKHYDDYYYPANMTLSVVGNFDLFKMKDTIQKSFGKFEKRDGKTVERKVYKVAKLNLKPYKEFIVGFGRNRANIGTKFIADDPKKVIILQSYVEDLAKRLNKVFRNKNGESYGTYGSYTNYHDGAIASIKFNTEHSAFDKNIAYAKEQLTKEREGELSDNQIKEALENSKKSYDAKEHDSRTLMHMLFNYQEFKRIYKDSKSPYDLLEEITPTEFKQTIHKAFAPANRYEFIARDYHFFPHEVVIFFAILFFISLYAVYRLFGTKMENRILFERRLTSKFISFFVILFSIILATFMANWLYYFLSKILPISPLWANGYDTPFSYLIYFVDFLISLAVLYFVIKKFFKWFYIKLFVTNHTLVLTGAKSKFISIADIRDLEVVPWSISKFAATHGISLLFWKPLLKVTSHQNDAIYLRTKNAEHLKDDLEFALFEKDRRGKRW
jgi:predicted Zn-dependent peptidase